MHDPFLMAGPFNSARGKASAREPGSGLTDGEGEVGHAISERQPGRNRPLELDEHTVRRAIGHGQVVDHPVVRALVRATVGPSRSDGIGQGSERRCRLWCQPDYAGEPPDPSQAQVERLGGRRDLAQVPLDRLVDRSRLQEG